MEIGKVIRKYRKEKNMTQEEIAVCLGVTAPAVNKWENGNSLPDITLLAPISRLLSVSLEELLAFRENLSDKEIVALVQQLDELLKTKSFGEATNWAKKKLEEYPVCYKLMVQFAVILDANRLYKPVEVPEEFDEYIESLYERALQSQDELVKRQALDSLYGFYLRKKRYEEAEKQLKYYSSQDPEKKRKQAQLYYETGKYKKAYQCYEETLFSDYQRVTTSLQGIYLLALQNQDYAKARMIVDKQTELARVFEMGKYYEISPQLELATMEKNEEKVVTIMEEMLQSVNQIDDFRNSSLFEHMTFKMMEESFLAEMKGNLKASFSDEATFGFLKGNEKWEQLRKSHN